ncbi:MAG: hypothetical protein JWO68_477 [Actinomycetia bacterium]|nr:hypothetical protein [Actinomycetes bacterium]
MPRVAVDGEAIRQAIAYRDRLDAAIIQALGDFDRAELWELDGATSLTAWLRDHGGMTAGAAGHAVGAYLCEGALHRVLRESRSVILDMGVTTKVITAALFTALAVRDEHCRFPECDRKASWCEAHHVVWFSRGGPTRLDNLVLLCSRHHHLLHKPGWPAKLLPDATFEVTLPDGRVRTSHPPGHAEAFW